MYGFPEFQPNKCGAETPSRFYLPLPPPSSSSTTNLPKPPSNSYLPLPLPSSSSSPSPASNLPKRSIESEQAHPKIPTLSKFVLPKQSIEFVDSSNSVSKKLLTSQINLPVDSLLPPIVDVNFSIKSRALLSPKKVETIDTPLKMLSKHNDDSPLKSTTVLLSKPASIATIKADSLSKNNDTDSLTTPTLPKQNSVTIIKSESLSKNNDTASSLIKITLPQQIDDSIIKSTPPTKIETSVVDSLSKPSTNAANKKLRSTTQTSVDDGDDDVINRKATLASATTLRTTTIHSTNTSQIIS